MTNKATFVQNEYRYARQENSSIRSTYPNTRELLHETNLSSAHAATVASNLFSATNSPVQGFKVVVDGIYAFAGLTSGPYRLAIDSPFYDVSRTFKSTAIEIDPLTNTTTFEVRG